MNQDINYWIARCASLEQELDIMKEQSTIKWQTGEPKGEGDYLVTTNFGHVTFDKWMKKYNEGGSYYDWELNSGYKKVRAWCKLSDIKPCKEETTN